MTHLLPPNLLKLFAPRPPLSYARSLGRPADYVKAKGLSGVAAILAQVKEENEGNLVASGAKGEEEGEASEEHFTYAEEVRRQINREEKKKKQVSQFTAAKENCKSNERFSHRLKKTSSAASCIGMNVDTNYFPSRTDKPNEDPEATGDPYKTLFLSRVVSCLFLLTFLLLIQRPISRRRRQRATFDARSRHTARSILSELYETRRAEAEDMHLSYTIARKI